MMSVRSNCARVGRCVRAVVREGMGAGVRVLRVRVVAMPLWRAPAACW